MTDDTHEAGQTPSKQVSPLSSPRSAGDSISVDVGDAAKNVAAGKNIIQIGSMSIPRWAMLSIVVILALVATLVGVVAYFGQQTGASTQQAAAILAYTPTPSPTVSPVPTVTPTPLPFAPAADGETMIVILPFHSTTATNSEPHKKIWRRIQELLAKMPNKSVTAVVDANTVLTADQQADAERVGRRYNASMVIWGEDTGVELIASFLNLRQPGFAAADVEIQETQRTAVAANPEPYREFVLHELPGELAFLALFAIGQTYYIDGDYTSTINTIESAVEEVGSLNHQHKGEQTASISPGLADAYSLLGWLYLQKHPDFDAAMADYNRAITLDPKDAGNYINRGVVHSYKGDLDQAIADYTKAITLDPKLALAYNNRSNAYYDNGDLDRAMADANQAITLDPKLAVAYNNRGNAYYDNGEHDLAMADYNQAITLDPKLALAYNNRGNVYYGNGEHDLAMADYNQAIALDPKLALAYNNRSSAYYDNGDLDRAMADANQAITLDPKLAVAYNNRGNAYYDNGEHDLAMADYNQAITLDPKLAVAYNSRGLAYYDNGEHDLAMADYNQAVTLDPKLAVAYNNRGLAYYDKGEHDLAMADYNQAITLDPKLAVAYNNRGNVYRNKNDLDRAMADYNRAITLDPQYALAYDNRGAIYAARGELDQAIVEYNKAISVDPKDAMAHNELCWDLALQQMPQQAMPHCDKAISLAKDPNHIDSRGLAHALLGDYSAAIADFQVFADWLAANSPDETQVMEQRRSWIESLRRGENPFTPETLEELKKQ